MAGASNQGVPYTLGPGIHKLLHATGSLAMNIQTPLDSHHDQDCKSGESSVERVVVAADDDRSGVWLIRVRMGKLASTPLYIC